MAQKCKWTGRRVSTDRQDDSRMVLTHFHFGPLLGRAAKKCRALRGYRTRGVDNIDDGAIEVDGRSSWLRYQQHVDGPGSDKPEKSALNTTVDEPYGIVDSIVGRGRRALEVNVGRESPRRPDWQSTRA